MTPGILILLILGAALLATGLTMTFRRNGGTAPWWLLIVFGVLLIAAAGFNEAMFR